jgi:ribosomal-protein-alanine N-acetyltransferase
MTPIVLAPPTPGDADELFDFETENREFFESRINARAPSYYSREAIGSAIGTAMRDAQNDAAYQFLVRNAAGRLVGRVNLTRVRRAHFHCAEIGYRIAQADCGKGYATQAVGQACTMAFGALRLVRLEAGACSENAGSRRVLERNGFVQFGRSLRSFELNGVWYDRLLFELRADADGAPRIRP